MPPRRKSRRNAPDATVVTEPAVDENDGSIDDANALAHARADADDADTDVDDNDGVPMSQIQFSQTAPDRSQAIDEPRQSERDKLANLPHAAREKIVTDLSRILLFKGLNGDPIDRRKVVIEALGDYKGERIANAVLDEARVRLRDVFGYEVRKVPRQMEEDLPARYKDRLYLINEVKDDDAGTHSINIHSVHREQTIEKGLLMMILAFAFCKGNPSRSGVMKGAGKLTRWITEYQLYSLLHRCDENIPSEPPSQEGRKKGAAGMSARGVLRSGGGVAATPDVDASLERFVRTDYLLRDKIEASEGGDAGAESQGDESGKIIAYAMGPRAAMEIGRRQIVMFCSNILDEQPDPTMLAEIDAEEEEAEEEQEAEEEEQVEEEPEPEPEPKSRKRRGRKVKGE